jgi:peroxiredoxin
VILAALGWTQAFPLPGETKSSPAPDFTLKSLGGEDVVLSKQKGKVVVVNFWATWCGPCRAEVPHLNAIFEKYRDKGLEIIGISLDRTGETAVRSFVEKNGMRYIIAMANSDVTQKFGGVMVIPTTFIVDREGNLRGRWEGYRDESALAAALIPLLDEKPRESQKSPGL